MPEVTAGQIALLLVAAALFAAGAAFSFSRLRRGRGGETRAADRAAPDSLPLNRDAADRAGGAPGGAERPGLRRAADLCLYSGLLVGLGVLISHAAARGSWLPLEDNFDALACLGLLLALFVLYTQRTRPLRGLESFVIPMVVLLLVAAAVFGRAKPHEYVDTTWAWVHRVTAYGGAAAFAVACAGGAMYLIVSRRLRSKTARMAGPGQGLGSLERLEHLMLTAVTLGFALLTIGALTGLAKIAHDAETGRGTRLGPHWFYKPKVFLSAGAWVVYAIVLHSPINPSFRGKKAAWLSVLGFGLMVAILVAVQFMPAGR